MNDACAADAANPLRAAHYADAACQTRARVVENVRMARDTYRIRLECPEIARRILPGQFVMLRLRGGDDPLLGRPFALYDTWLDRYGAPAGIEVVYLSVGRMTRRLARVKGGDELDLWGPLGNGFSAEPVEHLVMVAGGIGQTPFLALGREALGGKKYGSPARVSGWARRVTLCYGVRTATFAAGVDDFKASGIDVRLTSDDGTLGRHGLVTVELADVLDQLAPAPSAPQPRALPGGSARDLAAASDPTPGQSPGLSSCMTVRIACCGPEKMMEAVAHVAAERGVACELSLETPMACGIGICFSCVVKVAQADGGWDYKRTCVEGPVFDAEEIVW